MDVKKHMWNRGYINQIPLVCQYHEYENFENINKHDPFENTTSMVLMYFILIFFLARSIHVVLGLLQQNKITAPIIVGILIGPSLLTHNHVLHDKLFPPAGTLILKTFGYFGVMLHLFGLGVNASTTVIRNVGKKIIIIGLTSFLSGMGASFVTLNIITRINVKFIEHHPILGIPILIALNSVSPFIVMTSILIELKMINSELGKLVSSVSIVTDICGWFVAGFMSTISRSIQNKGKKQASLIVMTIVAYYCIIFFVLRPLVIYIARHTPNGKPMKESQLFIIITLVLSVAFVGDVIGQSSALGAFIFGLVLPDGPPLGMTLIEKFDTISTSILLPIFCTVSGLRTNLYSLKRASSPLFGFILVMGYLGKFLGTLVSSIAIGKVSPNIAVSLALILCCKGVVELSAYGMFRDSKLLTEEVFTLAILIMLIVTGVSIPLVKYIYDPSSHYVINNRQTILYSGYKGVIKILVCIYKEDNASSIIHLLQVAKPSKESPLCVFVLQLFELIGSKQAILAPYDQGDKKALTRTNSHHIVSAFKTLQKENQDHLRTQHFTAVAPYASMHNDICSLAYDRGVNIIILPFHVNKDMGKTIGESSASIRNVNRRVLRKAPCSVGVLIDNKGKTHEKYSNNAKFVYSVVILFLGGNDDREALAYSRRLAEDSNVKLTVMRVKSLPNDEESDDEFLDDFIINEFLENTKTKDNVVFKCTTVDDGEGTTKIIRSIEEHVDLVLVGRYHDPKLTAIAGLMEWSKWPELGAVGAMLTTWDFQFSVLVVQQPYIQEKLTCRRQNSTNSLISLNDEGQKLNSLSYRDDHFLPTQEAFTNFKFI